MELKLWTNYNLETNLYIACNVCWKKTFKWLSTPKIFCTERLCVAKSLKSLFRITTRHTHLERLIRANLLIFYLVFSECLCSTRSLSSHSLKSANLFTLLGVELKFGKFIGIVFVMSRDFPLLSEKKQNYLVKTRNMGKKSCRHKVLRNAWRQRATHSEIDCIY